MSEGELITPESSVVSSDAKQLPTDTVSSASGGTIGAPSAPQGLPGARGRLTVRDTQGHVSRQPSSSAHQPAQLVGTSEAGVLGIKGSNAQLPPGTARPGEPQA